MARRFLTADDVRRSREREIVVDRETVVTPQALEVAGAQGVSIVTSDGPWREPAPDRGPDASHSSPSPLPEPAAERGLGQTVVVTAVGGNRPGVLAEITHTIGELGSGVETVSQRVIDGYFHLILIVSLAEQTSFEELKRCLECLGGADDYVVHAMHERVYRFMHRI